MMRLQALAGEIGMDAELDNVFRCLYNGQLPDSWRKRAPITCKSLGGWMDHFKRRVKQYNEWVRVVHQSVCAVEPSCSLVS